MARPKIAHRFANDYSIVVDSEKLADAITYISRMHGMSVRKFAKYKAKVYNDIIYYVKHLKKDGSGIGIDELNKIFKGYGLRPERFIRFPHLETANKRPASFDPSTDVVPETLARLLHYKEINPVNIKNNSKLLIYYVPQLGKKGINFPDYLQFTYGMTKLIKAKFPFANVTFESKFDSKIGNESRIHVVFSPTVMVDFIFRIKGSCIFGCLDVRHLDNFNIGEQNTLSDKAFTELTYGTCNKFLRILERESILAAV